MPADLQQLINEVLKGFLFPFGYSDDILLFSMNAVEHFKYLRAVFDRLRTAELKLQWTECDFIEHELHLISEISTYQLPKHCKALKTCLCQRCLEK